jgi:esterase
MPEMLRGAFERDGLTLSFLDTGGEGRPLVALHAHWMEASTFIPLHEALRSDWRTIALDQRGHGFSDHPSHYTRADYLGDIGALLDHLRLDTAVLLGNSLGGANAYQFSARYPDRVSAMIIEDMGAEIEGQTAFALDWAGFYPTRAALEAKIGERLAPALSPSIRETARGWRLSFEPTDTEASQAALNGNHWDDWLASGCPALLIGGRDSKVTKPAHLQDMATRRQNTELAMLDGGHVVHFDNPMGFAKAVGDFLGNLSNAR